MKQLIEDLISAMEYHVEQTRPIHSTTVALQAAREALRAQPAPVQEPVGRVCFEGDEVVWTDEPPESGTLLYAPPPAQPAPVAWPAGLIDRLKAAEQRIRDGHAPRRIPADPTDVDLVLAEVRYLLEGKQPPFWIKTTPPAAQRQWVGLTQEDIDIAFDDTQEGGGFNEFAYAIEQRLKEKNNGM